jgi:hypothetical protein
MPRVKRPFADRTAHPDDASLAAVLGDSKAHWDAILAHVGATYEGVTSEWKHYGTAHGWQLKFLRKRRAFLYLIPYEGKFVAGMALSDAEVARLDEARVPKALADEIRSAKRYQEGRPARVEVKTKTHVQTVRRLLSLRGA